MATYIEQPVLPQMQPPSGTRVPWGVILHWLVEVLKFLVLVVFPFKNYDAKLGVLIGDDAKRTMGTGWLPSWAGAIESAFTQVVSEHLDEGVLARNERDFQSQTKVWVPLFRLLKSFLSAYQEAVGGGYRVRNFNYRHAEETVGVLTEHMDVWRKEATDSEQILDTPRADLVHLLATLVAMLSVAERIPYASLNVETVDKSESSDQPPITSQGGLADILFQKVLEFMTRTDHIVTVRPGPGQPGGG